MNCTGKMVRIARGRLGIFSMVKLKKKSLSRGSFRTHGQVIGNKNFFIFGLIYIKFLETESVMLHAKFQNHRTNGSGENNFRKSLTFIIWAWQPSWSCDLKNLYKLLSPPPFSKRKLHIKFGFDLPCSFRDV